MCIFLETVKKVELNLHIWSSFFSVHFFNAADPNVPLSLSDPLTEICILLSCQWTNMQRTFSIEI